MYVQDFSQALYIFWRWSNLHSIACLLVPTSCVPLFNLTKFYLCTTKNDKIMAQLGMKLSRLTPFLKTIPGIVISYWYIRTEKSCQMIKVLFLKEETPQYLFLSLEVQVGACTWKWVANGWLTTLQDRAEQPHVPERDSHIHNIHPSSQPRSCRPQCGGTGASRPWLKQSIVTLTKETTPPCRRWTH